MEQKPLDRRVAVGLLHTHAKKHDTTAMATDYKGCSSPEQQQPQEEDGGEAPFWNSPVPLSAQEADSEAVRALARRLAPTLCEADELYQMSLEGVYSQHDNDDDAANVKNENNDDLNNSSSSGGDGFFEVEAFEIYGLVPYIQSFVPTPTSASDNKQDLFKKTITDTKGSRWIRTALHGS